MKIGSRRPALAIVIASFAALTTPLLGSAELSESGRSSVIVGPNSTGPVVTQGVAGFDNGGIGAGASAMTPKIGAGQNPSSNLTLTYVPIPDNTLVPTGGEAQIQGGVVTKPTGIQPACPPGQTGYYVYDSSGQFAGVICVPNSALTGAGSASPTELALAELASSRQPWPNLTVGVNPNTGLTGLQSWFWLRPGNATMPQASATAGPLTVTVRAVLIDALWDFGDGSRMDAGLDLGRAYPRKSAIRHVYETDTFQQPSGYQVLATLRFGVWYSVNSGPWRFLGTKAKSYSLAYFVNQIQPEGVPAKP